ncbi:hypothetical protein FO519_006486 [Halicephalobus sp. NKZ332]|nr:hypothetical protein FO519_006486 [Halicephalobus sp. NKZ332]
MEQSHKTGPSGNKQCFQVTMTVGLIDAVDLGIQYTADELDEKRQNRSAYDYLCRLHEVRNWLVAYLGEEQIPPPIDLEENFRSGVLLARLANAFSPEFVPIERIFDLNEERFNSGGTVYRHTDNIMNWRRAMLHINFPEIIIPETVDIYEGRNIRTIFCLYALAIHLFRLRMAPAIRNEAGNVKFTEEEMEKIKERLQSEGVSISFGDVGSLLSKGRKTITNQDILAQISSAVADGDVEGLLKVLKSAEAGFIFVEPKLAGKYLEALKEIPNEELTASRIQATIQVVNEKDALDRLEHYLLSPEDADYSELSCILADLDAEKVIQAALPFYDEFLRDRRRGQTEPLRLEQVHDIINICNACLQVRISVEQGNADDVYSSLKDPSLSLEDTLKESYKSEYFHNLYNIYKETQTKHGLLFGIRELTKIVRQINDLSPDDIALSNLKKAAVENDIEELKKYLQELKINEYNPKFIIPYLEEFKKNPPKSREEVIDAISRVDREIEKSISNGYTVIRLNNALINNKEQTAKEILSNSHWTEEGLVKKEVLNWYYPTLRSDLKEKRNTLGISGNDEQARQVVEKYGEPDKELVVEMNDQSKLTAVYFEKPDDMQQWPLAGEEIKKILYVVNEAFDLYYKKAENKIRKSQMTVREYLKRKFEVAEARRRDRAARTIQNSYRKMKSRNHLGELQTSPNPSMDCVRQFIELLRDNELDYEEEISIEKTRSHITHLIKANQKLEDDLNELDHKIGLLVKNRISLQEVVAHKKKIEEDRDAFERRQPSIRRPNSRIPFKAIEYLFFHLQAEPVYLGNLFEVDSVDLNGLFANAIWPLFHFASETKNEFLLVQLYGEFLSRYINSLSNPSEFLYPSKKTLKLVKGMSTMFHAFASQPMASLTMKADLSDFQTEEHSVEHFNLCPTEMFETVHRRKAESLEEAFRDPHIVSVLESSKEFISKWAAKFTHTAVQNVELPKNVRYLLKVCAYELRTKFRQLKEDEIHRLVAKFLFGAYIELAMTDPKVVKRETGESLSPRQIEILKAVTQMINFAVAGQGYGADVPYMGSLNGELIQINHMFTSFAANQLIAGSIEEIYGMNQYSAFTDVYQQKLHIETKYIKNILTYLREFKSIVFKEEKSKLRQLVEQSNVPEDSSDTVILHLKPIPHDLSGKEYEENELFLETKRLVVELLLCGCSGNTIPKMLAASSSSKEEELHKELESGKERQFPSISAKKGKIQENLKKLEQSGYVSASDGYQAVITAIARDIYSKDTQRREELQSLNKTVTDLETKRKQYEERLDTYHTYLNNALDNISTKERRPSIQLQKGGKAEKKLQNRGSKEKVITLKVSGDKLMKKGIVVQPDKENSKLLSKAVLEIRNNPERKGVFEVDIKQNKKESESTEINFQDLLTAKDAGETEYALSKEVKVRPEALITYLNKKFHQK